MVSQTKDIETKIKPYQAITHVTYQYGRLWRNTREGDVRINFQRALTYYHHCCEYAEAAVTIFSQSKIVDKFINLNHIYNSNVFEGVRVRAKAKGFTLIELMIVVAIIAILAAIAIPAYQNYTTKARISEGFVALSKARTDVESYITSGGTSLSHLQSAIDNNSATNNVKSINLTERDNKYVITVNFADDVVPGASNQMIEYLRSTDLNANTWTCETNIESKFLPSGSICTVNENIDNENQNQLSDTNEDENDVPDANDETNEPENLLIDLTYEQCSITGDCGTQLYSQAGAAELAYKNAVETCGYNSNTPQECAIELKNTNPEIYDRMVQSVQELCRMETTEYGVYDGDTNACVQTSIQQIENGEYYLEFYYP